MAFTYNVGASAEAHSTLCKKINALDFTAVPAEFMKWVYVKGVRSADLVILILGENYGSVQGTSGVSPTHEEFLEARDTKPVLAFVQEGVTRDAQQVKFVSEVQGWQQGYFRGGFKSPEELKDLVTRALHDYQLAHAIAPLDIDALKQSAIGLLPKQRNSVQSPTLTLAVAGGPLQRILRPAELEEQKLVNTLHQRALFSEPRLFDSTKGMESGIEESALFLEQDRGAGIRLDEQGALVLRLPLEEPTKRKHNGFSGFALIQETVVEKLTAAIGAEYRLGRDTLFATGMRASAGVLGAGEHIGLVYAQYDTAASKLIAQGIDPVGHPDLVTIPALA